MKKKFNILGLLISFIFISTVSFIGITNVYASECNNDEYKELKTLSKKIEVNYLFEPNNKVFNVYIYNLSNKFNISLSNGLYMFGSSSQKKELGVFQPGSNFKATVYSSNKTGCPEELFTTIKVSIPYYNKYSEYKECKTYYKENICKKWFNTSKISEEEFNKQIDILNKQNQEKGLLITILDFVVNNWMFIVPITIVIIILIIFIIKKIKKKRDFKERSTNINFEIK